MLIRDVIYPFKTNHLVQLITVYVKLLIRLIYCTSQRQRKTSVNLRALRVKVGGMISREKKEKCRESPQRNDKHPTQRADDDLLSRVRIELSQFPPYL